MGATKFLPMHVKALGYVRNPFPYTPDAHSYFLTAHVEQQFTELSHCILDRKGFFLLTSDVGLGKSTLVRRLIMAMQQRQVRCALVVNTFLQGPELLGAIVTDFGLSSTGDLYEDHRVLNNFLLQMHRQNTTCLVVIDDAQNLSKSSLEMIRLLSNLETDQEKLVQILLVGQQELEDTLTSKDMRQLRSRIANHITLKPLTAQETQEYVSFRLQASCDNKGQSLSPQRIDVKASEKLWFASKGVPRNMHVILDRCMYGLMTRKELSISPSIMERAIVDTRYLQGAPNLHDDELQLQSPMPNFRKEQPTAKSQFTLLALSFLLMAALMLFAAQRWGALKLPEWPMGDYAAASLAVENKSLVAKEAAVSPVVVSIAAVTTTLSNEAQQKNPATQTVSASAVASSTEVAACDLSASAKTSGLIADESMLRAQLSVGFWDVFGRKLQSQVDACFDKGLQAYVIRWRAIPSSIVLTDGKDVAKYQIALSNFGTLIASDVDGKFGSRTAKAIKDFQSKVQIPVTGQFDALTVLVLNTAVDT